MIPEWFYIFGEKIKVSLLKQVNKGNDYAYWEPIKNKISVAKTAHKQILNQEQQEQSYCHELVHCILENIGEPHLSENEIFVDKFGKALHQILKSSHYGTRE